MGRVRLGRRAIDDFTEILRWTEERFGARQSNAYEALLRATLAKLAADPLIQPSKQRDKEIGAGFRTLHVARPGRHLILYRIETDIVQVVRILHDRMDVSRHLPPGE